MATVNPRIAAIVAHMPGMVEAVRAERDRVASIAEALFAAHDNPGRHEITKQDEDPDALVSLDGPAPAAVELGHWTPDRTKFVDGLHVLGRAVGEAAR